MSCINWIGGKRQNTWSNSYNNKQAESKTKVHVAVNYVSIKTKQLKNIRMHTFRLVEAEPYFDVKYACLFPIHNGYHQNFRSI